MKLNCNQAQYECEMCANCMRSKCKFLYTPEAYFSFPLLHIHLSAKTFSKSYLAFSTHELKVLSPIVSFQRARCSAQAGWVAWRREAKSWQFWSALVAEPPSASSFLPALAALPCTGGRNRGGRSTRRRPSGAWGRMCRLDSSIGSHLKVKPFRRVELSAQITIWYPLFSANCSENLYFALLIIMEGRLLRLLHTSNSKVRPLLAQVALFLCRERKKYCIDYRD